MSFFILFLGTNTVTYDLYCNTSDICKLRCLSKDACGLMHLHCIGTCYIDCDDSFGCPFISGTDWYVWDTNEPTQMPTFMPSKITTHNPTIIPTNIPSQLPTNMPSEIATNNPTVNATKMPAISNNATNNNTITTSNVLFESTESSISTTNNVIETTGIYLHCCM